MKKKTFYNFIIILILIFNFFELKSQNGLRFSQYMFNEIIVNPAYTGTKNGLYANLMYRKQWTEIKGAPMSRTLAVHTPIKRTNAAFGMALFNDEIGINKDFGLLVNYAYRVNFENLILSLGLQVRFINKSIAWSSLNAVREGNDPAFSEENLSVFSPNFGLGLYMYNEKFYFGASIPRFISGEIPSGDDMTGVDPKIFTYYLTGGFLWRMSGKIFVKPAFLTKYTYRTPAQFDLNLYFYFESKKGTFALGSGFHSGDSFIMSVGYQLDKNLEFSYAYDFTTSELSDFAGKTNEIVLSYRIEFVKKREKIISPRYF